MSHVSGTAMASPLPLTLTSQMGLPLTLSPQAGRGDAAVALSADKARPRHGCLLPVPTERRWRQPDEGLAPERNAGETSSHITLSGDLHAPRL
jgi:hypothetical protein